MSPTFNLGGQTLWTVKGALNSLSPTLMPDAEWSRVSLHLRPDTMTLCVRAQSQLSAGDTNISVTREASMSSTTSESACRDGTMWDRPQGTKRMHMATGWDKSPGGVWVLSELVPWPGAAGTRPVTHTHLTWCAAAMTPSCLMCSVQTVLYAFVVEKSHCDDD